MTNEDRLRVEIGARFGRLIETLEPTARAFATKTGIAPGYISQVVGGTKELSGLAMRRTATTYPQANFSWVLTGNGTMLLADTSPFSGILSEKSHAYGPSEGILEMMLRRLKDLELEVAFLKGLPAIAKEGE